MHGQPVTPRRRGATAKPALSEPHGGASGARRRGRTEDTSCRTWTAAAPCCPVLPCAELARHAASYVPRSVRDTAGGVALVGCFLCGASLGGDLGPPMLGLGLGLLRLGAMPHAVVASTAGWLLILVSSVIVTLYVPLLLAATFWGRALRVEPVAASFASACMGISAVAYAFVLPVVLRWICPHHPPQTDRSEKPLLRRLAAIAFLDVAGYSRLMGVDEETTLCEWLALRCMVIEPRVRSWRGRIVNRAGDGVLIEFRSALDAFHWAVDVQNAIVSRVHAGVPMQVRIAVHLGDVIVDAEGEVQGDRVNTVVRLQAYAEPGGIVVSQAIANEVLGKTASAFLDLGELRLRNILRPVHAFRLRTPGVSPYGIRAFSA